MLDLQNKVSSLEKIVLDQNSLLKSLISDGDNRDITNANENVEDSEGRRNTSRPYKPAQRPIRDARTRALSTLAVATRKRKGGRNESSATISTRAVTSELDVIDDPARVTASNSAPPTPSSSSAPAQFANIPLITDVQQVADDIGSEWVEVGPRRIRRSPPANVTRGTAVPGSTACLLSAAERKMYLHLYYVKKDTTIEQVSAHLNFICPGDNCCVEALKSRGEYASFKLTVPAINIDKYMSPEHWAKDVCIKPWRSGFRKKNQAQNEM